MANPSVCGYRHHAEFEKELECAGCRGPLVCGPFGHACEKCNPDEFKPCGNCRAKRIFCCC